MANRPQKPKGAVPEYKCCSQCQAVGKVYHTRLRRTKVDGAVTERHLTRFYRCEDHRCQEKWSVKFIATLQVLSIERTRIDREC